MRRLERLRRDFGVLQQMSRGLPRQLEHAQGLQAFYAPQAGHYDDFRDRLLPGREALVARLPLYPGARVVELGGGTGRNLDFYGDRLDGLASVEVVDLCPALLERARARLGARANVRVVEADATIYRPEAAVDVVYLSYALTMIPNWRAALVNALRMLKPGGTLGVVDFYVSPRRPASAAAGHSRLERAFWRRWFAHDGVRLDPEHLLTLQQRLPRHSLVEGRAKMPYLPLLRVPYYLFVATA
jgi:S-adenosylmethionine-diacylgycerolhomoserine-N-methlytransferase